MQSSPAKSSFLRYIFTHSLWTHWFLLSTSVSLKVVRSGKKGPFGTRLVFSSKYYIPVRRIVARLIHGPKYHLPVRRIVPRLIAGSKYYLPVRSVVVRLIPGWKIWHFGLHCSLPVDNRFKIVPPNSKGSGPVEARFESCLKLDFP
jgi:hypothetical protein